MYAEMFGILGLVLIIIGIIDRERRVQDILYVFGGFCLAIYSLSLKNWIFIVLQVVFTIAAAYDLVRLRFFVKKKKHHKKQQLYFLR